MEERAKGLLGLCIAVLTEELPDEADLEFELLVTLVNQLENWLCLLGLGATDFERLWVCLLKTNVGSLWQLLVGFAQLSRSVSVSAVFGELACARLLEELAHLRLVVVVGDVQHLVLHL